MAAPRPGTVDMTTTFDRRGCRMDGEQSASLRDKVARATEDVARRVQHEVAGRPVVSSTRERAQGAAQAAFGVLPATREDVARLQESLDRIEAALIHLTAR